MDLRKHQDILWHYVGGKRMSKYAYYQTVVQYRLPIAEDGKLGHPEIVKRFTTEIKGTQSSYVKKTDPKVIKQKQEEKQQQMKDLFKMKVSHE